MKKVEKHRLHFGVVFPSLDNTDKYNLLQNIDDYAIEHDIHLTAYFGTYAPKNYGFASYYEPCFEAIRRSTSLDGVIIYSGFIATNIGTGKFLDYFNSIPNHIPIVSIGLEIPNAYCIMVDNMSGMYSAVSHLIKKDGKKRIAFVKGPDGHPEAEARLAGYKQALKDNGIAPDENLILPGNFNPDGGRLAMEELLDRRKVEFDAVCCSNDDSALGAMRELKKRGYDLPKDAAFTGFDDIEEGQAFKPALSTVRQDISKFIAIAGDILRRVISGEKVDAVINVTPEFIARRSCGCNKKNKRKIRYQDGERRKERIRRMITSNLLFEFNLESLGNIMRESLPDIMLDFVLVGVYNAPIIEGVGGDRSISLLFGFDGEKRINISDLSKTPFPFSDCSAIKDVDFEQKRRTLFFLPLFFGNEEGGVALIAYNNYNPVNWYESLRANIAAVVKGASLLEKIQTLSVTDELTGLFNRRGFLQQVHTRLRFLHRQSEYIHVVFAIDMDGLKKINDTYGHAEGDISIKAFAEILKTSVRMEDIVCRLGGDEFVVYSAINSEKDISVLESRIRQNLDDYNAPKKPPYNVTGSIGTATLSKPTVAAFDQAMLDADNALYAEKQRKKEKGLTRG